MESKDKAHSKFIRVMGIIGKKWTLFIIWDLKDGTRRFIELQKRMGDVNSKTITKHLRDLEKSKIGTRTAYPEVPPKVEYTLTSRVSHFFLSLRQFGNGAKTCLRSGLKIAIVR